jgi:hypothetical protein
MFLPSYDSGDHLHPNDAGHQAMANAIDLSPLVPTPFLNCATGSPACCRVHQC